MGWDGVRHCLQKSYVVGELGRSNPQNPQLVVATPNHIRKYKHMYILMCSGVAIRIGTAWIRLLWCPRGAMKSVGPLPRSREEPCKRGASIDFAISNDTPCNTTEAMEQISKKTFVVNHLFAFRFRVPQDGALVQGWDSAC